MQDISGCSRTPQLHLIGIWPYSPTPKHRYKRRWSIYTKDVLTHSRIFPGRFMIEDDYADSHQHLSVNHLGRSKSHLSDWMSSSELYEGYNFPWETPTACLGNFSHWNSQLSPQLPLLLLSNTFIVLSCNTIVCNYKHMGVLYINMEFYCNIPKLSYIFDVTQVSFKNSM